jgi:hypothetical protein
MSKRYDQARADFEALEKIHELYDQVELDAVREELMREPTKTHAASIYESGIDLWFGEHGVPPEAEEIAERRL